MAQGGYPVSVECTRRGYPRVKEATQKLLAKAARVLKFAERLGTVDDAEFVVGRAYYAMFYIAEALLNEKGHRFRKHRGVHGALAEHFVKTGLLDGKYHQWLLEAFSKRITGDYVYRGRANIGGCKSLDGTSRRVFGDGEEVS